MWWTSIRADNEFAQPRLITEKPDTFTGLVGLYYEGCVEGDAMKLDWLPKWRNESEYPNPDKRMYGGLTMGKSILHLVPPVKEVSSSTIEILESLLEQAKSGELAGIIFVGMKQDRNRYGWTGKATHYPLETLGALDSLQRSFREYAKDRGY